MAAIDCSIGKRTLMEAKLGKTASQSSLSDEEDISLAGESSLMPHLPFYKIVKDGNLSQGDILPNCEIVIPIVRAIDQGSLGTSGVKKSPAFSYLSEVVIMSQSCDLRQDKTTLVALCPVLSLTDIFDPIWEKASLESKKSPPKLENIRNQTKNKTVNIANGKELGKYLLEPCKIEFW